MIIFLYVSLGANDLLGHRVWATNLNPRGMVGRIYEVNNYALLCTKYRRCGLHGFTKI